MTETKKTHQKSSFIQKLLCSFSNIYVSKLWTALCIFSLFFFSFFFFFCVLADRTTNGRADGTSRKGWYNLRPKDVNYMNFYSSVLQNAFFPGPGMATKIDDDPTTGASRAPRARQLNWLLRKWQKNLGDTFLRQPVI